MATHGKTVLRASAGVLAVVLLLLAPPMPAHAGIFERLFGGFRHAFRAPERLPDQVRGYAEPYDLRSDRATDPDAESGPAKAFCVRTCDGHFFPVVAHPGMSAADACHAFCPSSQTRLYSGSTIDGAVAHDGTRYADLPNAFVYRQHLVAGCTCNGRDQFGLAPVDINKDPTLRPGDVVATQNGMVAFTGRDNQTAKFTPAGNYQHFSKEYRSQLSAMENSARR